MNAPAEKALMSNMPRHFLDLSDHSGETLKAMIADAKKRKLARLGLPRGVPDADAPLAGRVLAMIFDKQSTRTRISFDVGARQLGGIAFGVQRVSPGVPALPEVGRLHVGTGDAVGLVKPAVTRKLALDHIPLPAATPQGVQRQAQLVLLLAQLLLDLAARQLGASPVCDHQPANPQH